MSVADGPPPNPDQDALLALAMLVQSSKGFYALLLGSGISQPAGIPVGWDVMVLLIRRLATLQGADPGEDPARWYRETYGEPPSYGGVLDHVARTQAERAQLLRAFFEPTEEEREQGRKVPTPAHHSIARLVARGYIRVIVTTNFDRLLEQALDAAGVRPVVVATPDQIQGMLPLAHSPCVIIKVHGDYLDTRLRNTPLELGRYDESTDRLLDRVLDEYGLVVCGWSATWDTALRAALERCPTRRFTTFWSARGSLQPAAQALVAHRQARVISIADADTFFAQLDEKVTALEDLAGRHPLSTRVAVATLKRSLPDANQRIRIEELVRDETERTRKALLSAFPTDGQAAERARPLADRLRKYEALLRTLQELLVAGCYWGEAPYEPLWIRSIERIAFPGNAEGRPIATWPEPGYPGLVLFYSAGTAAVAGDRPGTVVALLKAKVRVSDDEKPAPWHLNTFKVINDDVARRELRREQHRTALSDYLYREALREPLREIVPDDRRYERAFDRFEYLLSLVYADLYAADRGPEIDRVWAPFGCFAWRGNASNWKASVMHEVDVELERVGAGWPLLQGGFFQGSLDRLRIIKAQYDGMIRRLFDWF